jgi:hypothetical protein
LDDGTGNGTGIGGDEARALIIGGNSGSTSSFDITSNFKEFISIDGNFSINDELIIDHNQNTSGYTQNDAGPNSAYRPTGDWVGQGGQGYTGTRTTTNVRQNGETLTVSFKSTATIDVARTSGNADIRVTIGPGMGGKANLRTTYQVWEVGQTNATFPVNFLSFDGNKFGEIIVLNWETSSEINNSHFIVEKSQNARNFEAVGLIEASLINREKNTYYFEDKHPNHGISYYRLKQVDLDGQFRYSKIIPIAFEPSNDFIIYPNPVSETLNINLYHNFHPDNYKVYDYTGKLLLSGRINETGEVLVNKLNKGKYLLKLSDQKKNITKPFIKE